LAEYTQKFIHALFEFCADEFSSAKTILRQQAHSFGWLLSALAIGIGLRSALLSQPMRGDEAYTFLNFVNRNFVDLFDYTLPNNHVFHTLLVKISTLVLGASPASIRLPAFWAGLGAIALVFILARMLSTSAQAGFFAAITSAVFPYFVLYSTNARGYSLIAFFSLLLAILALRFLQRPGTPILFLIRLVAALGMFTMPTMAIPIAGTFLWIAGLLLLKNWKISAVVTRFAIPIGLTTFWLTLFFYSPVALVSNGIETVLANKFVKPDSWGLFLGQFIPQIQKSNLEFYRDIPTVFLAFSAVLISIGFIVLAKRKNYSALMLLPALLIGSGLVLTLQRATPYSRTLIYLLPFMLLTADFGWGWLVEKIRPCATFLTQSVFVGCAMVYAVHLIATESIIHYPDTSAFPEAPIVAQYLKPILTEHDAVHIKSTADWSVYFYFWYYELPQPVKSGERDFYIVKKSRYSILDFTEKPVIKLLDIGDMALYEKEK